MKIEVVSFKDDILIIKITMPDGHDFTSKYKRSELEAPRSRPMS